MMLETFETDQRFRFREPKKNFLKIFLKFPGLDWTGPAQQV